jgi:hypothetical protein
MDFIRFRGGEAVAATTAIVILLTNKVAISPCTTEDQSIHKHIKDDYDQSKMVL